jgi:hypothetical protein
MRLASDIVKEPISSPPSGKLVGEDALERLAHSTARNGPLKQTARKQIDVVDGPVKLLEFVDNLGRNRRFKN